MVLTEIVCLKNIMFSLLLSTPPMLKLVGLFFLRSGTAWCRESAVRSDVCMRMPTTSKYNKVAIALSLLLLYCIFMSHTF